MSPRLVPPIAARPPIVARPPIIARPPIEVTEQLRGGLDGFIDVGMVIIGAVFLSCVENGVLISNMNASRSPWRGARAGAAWRRRRHDLAAMLAYDVAFFSLGLVLLVSTTWKTMSCMRYTM